MSPHTRMAILNNDQLLYLSDSNKKIHFYIEEFNTWHVFESAVPTYMIAVDQGKSIYKMDLNKEIWEYNVAKSLWINITIDGNPDSDSSDTQNIVASKGRLYQLQADGAIWVYDAPAGKWETIDSRSQQKHSIAADGNGNLYQLHTNGSIWQYNGPQVKGWTMIDNNWETNGLVGGAGGIYLTHDDGSLFKFDSQSKVWDCLVRDSRMLQIAVGEAGVFQRQEDRIWKYCSSSRDWTRFLNDRTDDLVVGDSVVYVKHPDGRVSTSSNGPWLKLPPIP